MAIFSSLNSLWRRHKRKLFWTLAISISAYLLVDYFIILKLRNFQKTLKQEAFVREQIKRRFAQTQRDCYLTILALLPVLTTPIIDDLPVEQITQALKLKKQQQQNNNMSNSGKLLTDSMLTLDNLESLESSSDLNQFYASQSKTELWRLLKIKTVTRFLTLAYSLSGLILITRLSMNILARRSYLDTAILMAGGNKNGGSSFGFGSSSTSNNQTNEVDDYYAEQLYLLLSWWLLNKGTKQLAELIESLVVKHFDLVNARSEITISEFEDLMASTVMDLRSPVYRGIIISSIFPPNEQDALVETLRNTTPEIIPEIYRSGLTLSKLVDETYYFINEDPLFMSTYFALVENSSLITLTNNLQVSLEPERLIALQAEEVNQQEQENNKIYEVSTITVPAERKFKLASFLAQLSIQSGVICDANNEILEHQNEIGEYNSDYEQDSELTGNVYINHLDELEILDELSASVYSNFQ